MTKFTTSDAACSNEGMVCENCGGDASNGNNKIQVMYDKVFCKPCGENHLDIEKQAILKMIREGGVA